MQRRAIRKISYQSEAQWAWSVKGGYIGDRTPARGTWSDFLEENMRQKSRERWGGSHFTGKATYFIEKGARLATKVNTPQRRASQGEIHLEEEHFEGQRVKQRSTLRQSREHRFCIASSYGSPWREWKNKGLPAGKVDKLILTRQGPPNNCMEHNDVNKLMSRGACSRKYLHKPELRAHENISELR